MTKQISIIFKVPIHINLSTTMEKSVGNAFPGIGIRRFKSPAQATCCGRGVAECMRAGHWTWFCLSRDELWLCQWIWEMNPYKCYGPMIILGCFFSLTGNMGHMFMQCEPNSHRVKLFQMLCRNRVTVPKSVCAGNVCVSAPVMRGIFARKRENAKTAKTGSKTRKRENAKSAKTAKTGSKTRKRENRENRENAHGSTRARKLDSYDHLRIWRHVNAK